MRNYKISLYKGLVGVLIFNFLSLSPSVAFDEETLLELPDGFEVTIFADDLGFARHVVVREDGTVYVALRRQKDGKGIVALKDINNDGVAEIVEYFGELQGTGIDIHEGYLYFATDTEIVRFKFEDDNLIPNLEMEVVVSGFNAQRQHASKPFTFDDAGNIYVTVGAPANACQVEMRTPGSEGMDPCPLLGEGGGIWRFDSSKLDQDFKTEGYLYSTGIRNAMALDWNHEANSLYFSTHGRDQLSQLWPEYFDDIYSSEFPSEEFHIASDGSNHGWPYTYWDHQNKKRLQGPEYGGNGKMLSINKDFKVPLAGLPGHWAPNDLIFYTGDHFPKKYKGGAFIAFHGSWNRAPLPQAGYKVVFFPFNGPGISGDWEIFVDGFAGKTPFSSPRDANFRPMGLAEGPDGKFYITDSVKGRVWRVTYKNP